jgi:hypothetical protein
MNVRVALRALGAAMLAAPPSLAAQVQDQQAAESEFTEIEVLGQREMARRVFKENLAELTAPLSVVESMPRFFQPLCIEVAGLEQDQAQFVIDRIIAASREVGLGAARPGCRTNALVIAVHDPERLFEKLVSKRLDLVGVLPFRDVHVRRIRNELRTRQPVVWWNVLAQANEQGVTFNDLGLAINQNVRASRMNSPTYLPKALSVVMYDADQLGGTTLGQIADHAALYILGSPRRQIEFGNVDMASVLRLFDDGPEASPEGLTDFDRAYLKGLYALSPGAFQSQAPRSVVAAYAAQCEEQQSDCRIRLRK